MELEIIMVRKKQNEKDKYHTVPFLHGMYIFLKEKRDSSRRQERGRDGMEDKCRLMYFTRCMHVRKCHDEPYHLL